MSSADSTLLLLFHQPPLPCSSPPLLYYHALNIKTLCTTRIKDSVKQPGIEGCPISGATCEAASRIGHETASSLSEDSISLALTKKASWGRRAGLLYSRRVPDGSKLCRRSLAWDAMISCYRFIRSTSSRHSVVASADLAVESSADALLIIIVPSRVTVAWNHASAAFDVLLETIALAVGNSPHSRHGVV